MPGDGERTECVPSQRIVNRLGVGGFIHRFAKSLWYAVSMRQNMPAVEPVEPKLHQPFGKNQNNYQTNKPFRFHADYKLGPYL